MNVADIIIALSTLTRKELEHIRTQVDFELNKYTQVDPDLYFYIIEEMGQKPISIAKFERSSLGPKWKENQVHFHAIIEHVTEGNDYKRVQILALKRFLATILLDYLKECKMPSTMESVCFALGKFAMIFDRAFPGYRKSQLGPLIMARLDQKE